MSAAAAGRHASRAAVRQGRIVAHLRVTGTWLNAFSLTRVLGLSSKTTTARDCAAMVRAGFLEQALREASDGSRSVHYHAR